MISHKQKMRIEREAQTVEKMVTAIDVHDLLHSIFWNKPKRQEMRAVRERLNSQLEKQQINLMKKEIEELLREPQTVS